MHGDPGEFESNAAKKADMDPVSVDKSITFDKVGGLDEHVRTLKEMVMLPLLYPEIFSKFGVKPPRGVIFHGPPGTGELFGYLVCIYILH